MTYDPTRPITPTNFPPGFRFPPRKAASDSVVRLGAAAAPAKRKAKPEPANETDSAAVLEAASNFFDAGDE